MKKDILIGGLLLILGFAMSSCEKQTNVYMNNWQIVSCDVGYSQWRYTGDESKVQFGNHYYYCGYDIEQLTSTIYKDGNVQVYLKETNARGEEYKRPLPFSRHKEVTDENGNPIYYYTETYDYFYGTGWIEFNYTASDFAYEEERGTNPECRPDSKRFEVVLTW